MGGKAEIAGNAALVHGPTPLHGCEVIAHDLRTPGPPQGLVAVPGRRGAPRGGWPPHEPFWILVLLLGAGPAARGLWLRRRAAPQGEPP
jgi:hypothetical protein